MLGAADAVAKAKRDRSNAAIQRTDPTGETVGWDNQIFRYCERGLDPAFWAEPFNALSNAAFLAVALAMFGRLTQLPSGIPRRRRYALYLMVLLVATVSTGSFLFHTFATRWAEIADVAPITGFMVLYLAFALRFWLGLGHGTILSIVIVFLGLSGLLSRVDCVSLPFAAASGVPPGPCLRGTIGYAPALVALVVTGFCIGPRRSAGRSMLIAAATFGCAMTLRWLDQELCLATRIMGVNRGTHALWHLLNALTLAIMLRAAIEAAASSARRS